MSFSQTVKYEENLLLFYGKYQTIISLNVLKTSAFSLVLRTRENTDISNTFDEIHCFIMSENLINLLLGTMIYLSYVSLTIQLSQFDW